MATKAARKKNPKPAAKKPAAKKLGAKRTPQAPKANGSADVCFVIMPFGGWLDSYYLSIYRPAIEAAGLDPHRADDLFRPSTIVNDIWSYTRKAKVLLADLTGKNPNVFYELGLAHALAKPVILIAESMDDIPFDLRALRIILYDKNAHDWGQLLGEKIETALREVLSSPVEAVLPAFLEVRETNKASISQEQKDLIEIKQEMDLLRRSVAIREASYLESRRRGDADYARDLIGRYVRAGLPPATIVRRVVEQAGAPEGWVERQLDEYLARRASLSGVSSSVPPEAAPTRTPQQEAALSAALRAAERLADAAKAPPTPTPPAKPAIAAKPAPPARPPTSAGKHKSATKPS